jgi:hypothetical protein
MTTCQYSDKELLCSFSIVLLQRAPQDLSGTNTGPFCHIIDEKQFDDIDTGAGVVAP